MTRRGSTWLACFSLRMVCDRPRCPDGDSRFRRAGGIKYKSVHIGVAEEITKG